MNANTPSSELVRTAYRLLKQDTCCDKMDLFQRANVAAYEASDSFQKRQDALSTIVDELRKEAPSPKSQRAIKAWQERDYATTIAVARKVPQKILQEGSKVLMWYDQALTRTGEDI
ncbi:MAG: hypothetical protein MIO92_14580 [Methanosarcinaceae archaeon]|nr:hypothetical protein [Methanosarcinaceae archaeon]